MDIIVVVYKQRDQIDFIGKTRSKLSKMGRPIVTFIHLGTKQYSSKVQRRKEEIALGTRDVDVVFKEV